MFTVTRELCFQLHQLSSTIAMSVANFAPSFKYNLTSFWYASFSCTIVTLYTVLYTLHTILHFYARKNCTVVIGLSFFFEVFRTKQVDQHHSLEAGRLWVRHLVSYRHSECHPLTYHYVYFYRDSYPVLETTCGLHHNVKHSTYLAEDASMSYPPFAALVTTSKLYAHAQ